MKNLYEQLQSLITEGQKEVAKYLERKHRDVEGCEAVEIEGSFYTRDAGGRIVFLIDGQFYNVQTDIETFLYDASIAANRNRIWEKKH